MKLISDILICSVAPDFGSGSARFMGRLGFIVGDSASYSYFRVSFTENNTFRFYPLLRLNCEFVT